jgi:hypothetical protein
LVRKEESCFRDGKLEPVSKWSINPNNYWYPDYTKHVDSTKIAYQLEPSGTQFNKPKNFFHYTDEVEERPPDLKSFALQIIMEMDLPGV